MPTEATLVATAVFPPSFQSHASLKIDMNFSLLHHTLITGLLMTCCFVVYNPLYCRVPTSVTPNVDNPEYMLSGDRRVYGLMLRLRTYTETKKKKKK